MVTGNDFGATYSFINSVESLASPTLCPARNDPRRFQAPTVSYLGQRVENLLKKETVLTICRFPTLFMGQPRATTTALGKLRQVRLVASEP